MISAKQLRAIYASAREHNVSVEDLHDDIAKAYKIKSFKELTSPQAARLLNGIRGRRPEENWHRRQAQGLHGRKDVDTAADAVFPVNKRERELLKEAADLRGWDDATLTAFIERQLGKPVVVTMADFNKVFWPLKNMNRREGLYL